MIQTGQVSEPERVHLERTGGGWRFYLHVPSEHLPHLKASLAKGGFSVDEELKAALTLTGHSLAQSPQLLKLVKKLGEEKIKIDHLLTSPQGLSFLLAQSQLAAATQTLGSLLPKTGHPKS